MSRYWLSQIIIILAYIILGIGFRKKEKLQILKISCVYQVLITISYVLLHGVMGIIASLIALFRNFLFIYNEKRKKENSKWSLAFFGIITIILTIIFYKSPMDIVPCILTLVGIFSYWCKSTKVTRLGNLVISSCYIIYAISLKSWFTIICEAYLSINSIIGFIKHELKKKTKSKN